MRNRGLPAICLLCVAVLLVAMAGCETRAPRLATATIPSGPDQAAERLHDMCGSLLLFHGSYHRMPRSLEELCLAVGLQRDRAIDPSTGQQFTYVPEGLANSLQAGKVVLLAVRRKGFDVRWCVAVKESGRKLSAQVLALPATAFDEGSGR